MTENKRFLIGDAGELIDLNNHKFIDYGDECCKLLNELSDENEQLKQQKERYKRLSEIREKEINNHILTIEEFIDDYSDDYEIKNVLLDLFYSEVKEYDLSKKYMALKKENEQLKGEVAHYKLILMSLEQEAKRISKIR